MAVYGHGYRALLRPATSNLVVYPCSAAYFQSRRVRSASGCHSGAEIASVSVGAVVPTSEGDGSGLARQRLARIACALPGLHINDSEVCSLSSSSERRNYARVGLHKCDNSCLVFLPRPL